MVRLLHGFPKLADDLDIGFNPTMVRLLRGSSFTKTQHLKSFQSHNGAIAASSFQFLQQLLLRFQSHNGAIAARESGEVD